MRRLSALVGLFCAVWLGVSWGGCGDDSGGPGTTGFIEGIATLEGAGDHSGILISLDQSGATATTGPQGRFRIEGVEPGTYLVTATRAGYVSATSAPVDVSAGHVSSLSPSATTNSLSG